jgi:hypothetical protein
LFIQAIDETLKIAIELEQVQFSCQVPQDSMDVYTDNLNFELLEVVQKWSLGEVNIFKLLGVQKLFINSVSFTAVC